MSKKTIWGLVVAILIGAIYIFYTEFRPVVIFGLRDDFAHAIPLQSIPEGISGIRASDCGVCHREIYAEWKTSIHARAYEDPFFQAYWKKDNNIWICLNCHTPLVNQQPELILDIPRNRVEKASKIPNPNYDPDFQKEGVTCASCHVRDGVILGPYRDSKAPHPTRYDPIFQSTEICYRCHQVPAGPFQFYRFGPCGTYPEYEGGHYYKEGYICQTCHMPEVNRPAAIGGPMRSVRQHIWRGGHDPKQIRRAISATLRAQPDRVEPGQKIDFTLTLTNSGAGHYLPTGDPDRYFTIQLQVIDGRGRILKDKQYTMGRWIMWQPVIWEIYDNRLAPLASRDYLIRYKLPSKDGDLEGLKVRSTIRYHIMTEKAHTMLKEKYGLTSDEPYVFTIIEEEVEVHSFLENGIHPLGTEESWTETRRINNQEACDIASDEEGNKRSSRTPTSLGRDSGEIAEMEIAS